jgi:tRNA-specific 2-thiouridylase
MNKKVLVAMSGGVDSSIAALLLKKEGYDVSGVTMCLGIAAEGHDARCCGADAIDDAKQVCDRLHIPHYVFDYADELEGQVIARFISDYKKGRTPNPCVECNRHLKFGSLLNKAKALGFDFLATGHYAAIDKNENGYCLSKPRDKKKDQTYFLYSMPYEGLPNVLFPLARLTKDEVREMAQKENLAIAQKQESQDVCFVTQKNYQQFLIERGEKFQPGLIVDRQGKILGKHRGIIFHTVGQRGGLGISHKTPLYVVSIDPDKNLIVVGDKKDLMAKGLLAGNMNMLVKSWPQQIFAKIRYRKKEALCAVTTQNGRLKVIFAEEQEAITPGQSVVFYDQDQVLGGGEIEEVLHGTD